MCSGCAYGRPVREIITSGTVNHLRLLEYMEGKKQKEIPKEGKERVGGGGANLARHSILSAGNN